ncbi:aminopeptidase N [Arboricoccus pini]|uniref:Aminopeptidase N n=1 Tax=Arboricoccus pini TaxID=1963835 RepID=A0A212R328_9PROT|nr:aminopeptidase N [Arboricoccus pini]SNB66412.1 aminopeptidase N [Arboricoccus pini]
MSPTTHPEPIRLADYRPPVCEFEEISLDFVLDPDVTTVTSRLKVKTRSGAPETLALDGRELTLKSIKIDDRPLGRDEFQVDREHLTLIDVPSTCLIEIVTTIAPRLNSALMGLYLSNGIYCTQCEAEGFRRITYFLDRPDVMTRYKVRIEADLASCPVLLSNGNPVGGGKLANGRHFALWEDPFRKPAYLFALVAGDLACLEDHHVTRSGRRVALKLYADSAAIDQCAHAMDSLKRSMRWDEDAYGLEYDLDLFQIVGVGDFNFGAMENKGLNIFNTSALLARTDTSTDGDFQQVERIVAHEYFHNWSGDRVTCRDWFQLTLKEGLTVFRDQQFSSDMHSAAVKRIADVMLLRETQFAEDAGPLAHPIRPESYVEINNFYTRTVYEKGAEVVRMLHTLLGAELFRKGIDLYFARHDGSAVTCEDFVQAMADVSGRDLRRFMRWYSQAGTPEVRVTREFDSSTGSLTLEFTQSTPPTPGQQAKLPLHIPIRVGLVGRDGQALPLQLAGENAKGETARVLELTEERQSFTFVGLDAAPVPSILRGFSAPVRLRSDLTKDDLLHLLKHDEDAFNRWEAAQSLAAEAIVQAIRMSPQRQPVPDADLIQAYSRLLEGSIEQDHAFVARTLSLPGRSFIAQQLSVIDVDAMHRVFKTFQETIGRELEAPLLAAYRSMARIDDGSTRTAAMAARTLKNAALAYLVIGQPAKFEPLAVSQYRQSSMMTDRLSALRILAEIDGAAGASLLEDFYGRWQNEPLVVNKWFALQAGIEDYKSPERVEALMQHPAFTLANPNRVRALLGTFSMANLIGFHREDGAGYRLLADKVIELDSKNAQVAARLLTTFGRWRRFDLHRQQMMKSQLERILAVPGLSRDSYEIASKSLG